MSEGEWTLSMVKMRAEMKSLYREPTVAERLAGLTPEDGNLEAALALDAMWAESSSSLRPLGEASMRLLVAAWLGVSDG